MIMIRAQIFNWRKEINLFLPWKSDHRRPNEIFHNYRKIEIIKNFTLQEFIISYT